ncbi:hypothetical protein [Haloferax volcanii]|jgi:hypothetical protein|uniref:hypothetical protein n=1 Tax=Haloferax volcanii TaxID=2246 RepID=UPI00249B1326|nr:hypothetical protein [Haloferax alexandrinus]
MESRRQLLTNAASLGVIGFAGCLGGGLGDGSWKSLTIRNEDEAEHTVAVRASGDFQPQTIERALEAGTDVTVDRFIPQLDYDHTATITVTVDGTQVTSVERRVAFDIDVFTVTVTGPEAVRVEPKSAAITDTTNTHPPTTSTTTTTETTDQLTDRTAESRLSLHPETEFSGRITVGLDGEEVFNQTITDYDGDDGLDLTNQFQPTRQTVTVAVNGTVQWERPIGTTESFELTILENGTVNVRSHTIR